MTMNARDEQCEATLAALARGGAELDWEQIELHLSTCASCGAGLARFTAAVVEQFAASDLLDGLESAGPMPAGPPIAFPNAAAREERRRRRLWPRFAGAAAATAAAAAPAAPRSRRSGCRSTCRSCTSCRSERTTSITTATWCRSASTSTSPATFCWRSSKGTRRRRCWTPMPAPPPPTSASPTASRRCTPAPRCGWKPSTAPRASPAKT